MQDRKLRQSLGHENLQRQVNGFIGSPLATAGIQARNFTSSTVSFDSGLAPEFYTPRSLAADLEYLCDPDQSVSDAHFLNVAVKYFYTYVHDGAHKEAVKFSEISRLYEQFSRHQSLNEPADDIEIMNRLRLWSSVLRVLADAPRAAHVMRAVIGQAGAPRSTGGPYLGVDIGVGTGIMLLALQIQARRNGFTEIQTLGYQTDPVAGERTHDLVHMLGMGSVMLADPAREGAYGFLKGRSISYVANEMVAGIQQSLNRENFFNKYKAFFGAVEKNADNAGFFPEGLIAHSGIEGASVILAKENGFSAPAEYMNLEFIPQGLIIEGKVLPLHKLGEDFFQYLI